MRHCESLLKGIFGISADVIISLFETKHGQALLLCVDGLVDRDLQDRDMIAPLKAQGFDGEVRRALRTSFTEADNLPVVIGKVLEGATALFFEGEGVAFVSELKQWDMRSVETPDAEAVIRGPKEGFNENLRTNTSLLRRKIKTPKLIVENLTLGRQTNTAVSLVYIEGIVNQRVLEELKERMSRIDTDAILESGYIEQYIERRTFSVIPRTGMTQKPDILAARILEGRVGILCDGTPHALTVPHLFIEDIQTAEDYYSRTMLGNFMRLIRLSALLFSLLLPGLFLAITTYHHEMIPSVFMATVISSVEKTPFPLGAEVFLLMLMFELLRESGTRLPRAIGSAISIVGALIIGDAAVSAGIVSAPVVIVVALTAVCGFVNTSLNEFITIYRLIFLVLGG
jgi:spore germination protein KA